MFWALKTRLNATVLLSAQNTCLNLWIHVFVILRSNILLLWTYPSDYHHGMANGLNLMSMLAKISSFHLVPQQSQVMDNYAGLFSSAQP